MISNKIISKIILQIHYPHSFHLCILFITYQNEESCLQTDNQNVSDTKGLNFKYSLVNVTLSSLHDTKEFTVIIPKRRNHVIL